MQKIISLFILTILAFATAYSQGGSNYSSLGIGDLNYFGSAAYAGTNGLSISYPVTTTLNPRNPAMWSKLTTTRLNAGYLFNQNVISNGTTTLWQNNGSISGFSAAFCLDTAKGMTIGLGMSPKSKLNYYISNPISIEKDGLTLDGQALYQGKGGLNDIFLGMSGRFFNFIEVGGEAYYTFGLMSRLSQSLFSSDATTFSPGVITNDYFTGWGGKFGINCQINKDFSIGGFWELTQKLNYENRVTITGIYASTDTTMVNNKTSELPQSYGLGLSYRINRFLIGADYIAQDYSKLSYNSGSDMTFRTTNQYILGLTYFGNPRFSRDYFDRVTYRLGLAYRDLYYNIRGNDMKEMSMSLGFRLPSSNSMFLDAGFVFGTRGTLNNGLLNEQFGKMYIDISIGEVWFKPYKRDFGKED
ncbi:MAG: hypothetical protein WCR42_11845 [bacterium]